jgi:hypothetical protein
MPPSPRCPPATKSPRTFGGKDDEARAKVLDRLTAEAQELGMGY